MGAILMWTVCAGLCCRPAGAQVQPGDIAVIAYNTSGDDEFAWVTFRTLSPRTVLRFTDASVSNGWFRWTEHLGDSVAKPGPLQWHCTNAVAAGTVVRWQCGAVTNWSLGETSGGRMDLSSSGDQIIIYVGDIVNSGPPESPWRGDASGATLLFAANFANNGWGLLTNQQTSTSMIPPGLSSNACTAIHISKKPNGFYNGSCTGTAMQLRRCLAEPLNWTVGSSEFGATQWVNVFSVSNGQNGTVFTLK